MDNKETFHYIYSAKEQEEIKAIRSKYASPSQEEDKIAQLRRLDAAVTQKANVVSLVIGMIGALVMGAGMSLIMTELGALLGLQVNTSMLLGILIGVPGMVMVCAAYPVYNRIVKKERDKIAPEIIRLTDELLK